MLDNAFSDAVRIMRAPGLRDWDPADCTLQVHGASDDWYSPYPAEIYRAAQTGEREHPLQRVLLQTLDASEPILSERLTLRHDVTGCAPDVAAYLAGEPESMLTFDVERDHARQIDVLLDMGCSHTASAGEIAEVMARIIATARAYSCAHNCLVVLHPLVLSYPRVNARYVIDPYAYIFEPIEINGDIADLGVLALLADPRTYRQLSLGDRCIRWAKIYRAKASRVGGIALSPERAAACVRRPMIRLMDAVEHDDAGRLIRPQQITLAAMRAAANFGA